MSETRVIVHAADPEPLLAVLTAAHPRVHFTGCDSYAVLPTLLDATRPDVVFTIRFAGTPSFPREALLGPSGRAGSRSAGRASIISGAGIRAT